ncbi:hypothetical protein [Halogeometricum luteum]|nr:hypothetical protein [Halogeometricum sp. S3BR5-2]
MTNDSTSKPMVDAFDGMHPVWKLFSLVVAVVLLLGAWALLTA